MSTSAYFHKNKERSLVHINFYRNVTHELLVQYNGNHSHIAQLKEEKKSSHIRSIITENRFIHKLPFFKTVSLKQIMQRGTFIRNKNQKLRKGT